MSRWLNLLCASLLIGVLPLGRAAERALDKEVVIHATLDQAWAAWTTRDGIVSFFAPDAQIEPRVGGAFHIFMDPLAEPGLKGADEMRYLALQPQKMVSFDWNAPPSQPVTRAQRTFVVVRFFPLDAQTTRVTLHHTGWGEGAEWDQTFAYFDRAWGRILANLKQRFETGPQDWSDWMRQLEQAHAADRKR